MPQVKTYTAQQAMRLDCGHTIQAGARFQVTRVFTCDQEGSWPLRILMACFTAIRHKQRPQPAPTPKPQSAPKQNPQPVASKASV